MNMQIMVRSLLIYRLTGSATILGAVSFAHFNLHSAATAGGTNSNEK